MLTPNILIEIIIYNTSVPSAMEGTEVFKRGIEA
jgi:hypothetical protein